MCLNLLVSQDPASTSQVWRMETQISFIITQVSLTIRPLKRAGFMYWGFLVSESGVTTICIARHLLHKNQSGCFCGMLVQVMANKTHLAHRFLHDI